MESLESMDSRVFEDADSSSSSEDEDTYHESVSLKRDGTTNSAGINIFNEQTYVLRKSRSLPYSYSFSYVKKTGTVRKTV